MNNNIFSSSLKANKGTFFSVAAIILITFILLAIFYSIATSSRQEELIRP